MRMYLRYAERRGWKTEMLSATESDLGGYKEATIAIKAPGSPAPADGVWARMKFEGGVHRVQRVPVTESQGRVHTSAAGVFVAPEADETVDVPISDADLRVDVFRSSGPGGQSVNTTDSAVRITHLPTGIVVSCQNEKSQLQNKEQAMRILRARLLAAARATADAAAADARRSQVRTVDRSERVRTYNFSENRIADHRVGYKAYNLDAVLDGDLDAVLDALENADRAERIGSASAAGHGRSGTVVSRESLRAAIVSASATLDAAGVPTPRVDAEELAAFLIGRAADPARHDAAGRVELGGGLPRPRRPQGASGSRCSTWSARCRSAGPGSGSGPGVFIPRPETESLVGWSIDAIAAVRNPVVIDLCTGSGAIALAIAPARPDARVIAVERSPAALAWARRNIEEHIAAGGSPVELRGGDFADERLLLDLDAAADLVTANPPYVPDGTPVEPEVGRHDPPEAVFAGPDGLAVIRPLISVVAGLLKVGGVLAIEHDDAPGRVGARAAGRPPGARRRAGPRRPDRPAAVRHRQPGAAAGRLIAPSPRPGLLR